MIIMPTKEIVINGNVKIDVTPGSIDPVDLYKEAKSTGFVPACIDNNDEDTSLFYYMPTNSASVNFENEDENTFWKMYVTFSSDASIAEYDYFGSNQVKIPTLFPNVGDIPVKIKGLNIDFIYNTYLMLFTKPSAFMNIPENIDFASYNLDPDIPFMRNTDLIFDQDWLASDQEILKNYVLSLKTITTISGTDVTCVIPFNHMFYSELTEEMVVTEEELDSDFQPFDLQTKKTTVKTDELLKELLGIKSLPNFQSQNINKLMNLQQCNLVCKHSSFNLYGGNHTSESFNFANQPAGINFCSAPERVNANGISYCSFFNQENNCVFFSPIENLKASTEIKLHSGSVKIDLLEVMTKESSGSIASQYCITNSSIDEVITHVTFPNDIDETDQLAFAKEIYNEVLSSYAEEKQDVKLEEQSEDKNSSYILSVVGDA